MKLFVAKLNRDAVESDLLEWFGAMGPVKSVKVVTDRDTGQSKCFGFVEMESREGGQRALDEMNGKEYMGFRMVVKEAEERGSRPPRPGGGPGGSSGDWFHVNGVNYNAELDQIAFSSRHASEIYIIDHSTTSAEAAAHTGGNSGMGGDIIYRWGNPSNYGAPGSQQIPSAVHDVRWITNDGRPNGGFLQFFNNNGGGNNTSTVDAIETPLDGYNYTLEPGQAYGPSTFSWRHTCNGYASGQSASNRMSNGNVFVNLSGGQGGAGYMYEEDSLGNIVWQYNAGGNGTPKAFRYECKHPGIAILLDNPCEDETALSEQVLQKLSIYPNPSNGFFEVRGLESEDIMIQVTNASGVLITEQTSKKIDLTTCANGLYFVTVIDEKGNTNTQRISLVK